MGMVIGTPAYMAPEQATGLPADKRADIWAYGAVLFEMLTGKKLFEAGDVSEMLASVLIKDPDISSIGSHVPDHVRSVVRQCLVKDPKERLRDIGDVRLAMRGVFETTVGTSAEQTVTTQLQVWQRPVPALAVGLMLLLIGGFGVWRWTRPAPLTPIRVPLPVESLAVATHPAGSVVALSPDGSRLAYVSGDGNNGQLYVRRLDAFDAAVIDGADDAYSPFFSPDGEWVGFATGGGELKKVRLAAGAPVTITTIEGRLHGATWGPDDTIVFSEDPVGGGLSQVSALGGRSASLLQPDPDTGERYLNWPSFLPDGRAVLFTGLAEGAGPNTLHVSVLSLESGEVHRLLEGGGNARYVPTGHLVHAEGGSLYATPFDADRLRVVGPTLALLDGVAMGMPTEVDIAHYDVAENGTLVYMPGEFRGEAAQGTRTLTWVDHGGEETQLPAPAQNYVSLSLSPDERSAAVGISVGLGNVDVWVSELSRGSLARLTTDEGFDGHPLWHPDGRRLAFTSDRGGQLEIFWQAADGSGTAERLLTMDESATEINPYDWSPDGTTLFVQASLPGTGRDVGMVSVNGPSAWEPLIQTAANEWSPAISPDGRWLAYTSDETGRNEVYLQRFPELDGRQVVSVGGGFRPIWSESGRELFYQRQPVPAAPDAVMRVTLDLEEGDPPSWIVETPERLFGWRYFSAPDGARHHDVSQDGQRFLMITRGAALDAGPEWTEINVVFNWQQELLERVPLP